MATTELPRADRAEQSVLGCILIHPDVLLAVADWLSPDDFHDRRCGLAYAAALELLREREPADLVTLAAALAHRGELARIGGAAWLAQLVDRTPVPVHIEYYGRIVQRAAECRRLLQAGGEIARIAHEGAGDGPELRAQALGVLLNLAGRRDQVVEGREASSRLLDEISKLARQEVAFPTFGLPSLDRVVLLRPGSYTILGARTSEGKTALAMDLARNNALGGLRVLYFSTEMRPEDLQRRQVAYYARIGFRELCGRLSDEQLHQVTAALGRIGEWPGSIDYIDGAVTLDRIRLEALSRQAQGMLDLVIVDYVQKVQGPGERLYDQVTAVSRGLQSLARDYGLPIVAVSQLSRKALGKERPTKDDLRESGAQEEDADAVLLLQRDPEHGQGVFRAVLWWVDKNRNGPLDNGALMLDTVRFHFEEMT